MHTVSDRENPQDENNLADPWSAFNVPAGRQFHTVATHTYQDTPPGTPGEARVPAGAVQGSRHRPAACAPRGGVLGRSVSQEIPARSGTCGGRCEGGTEATTAADAATRCSQIDLQLDVTTTTTFTLGNNLYCFVKDGDHVKNVVIIKSKSLRFLFFKLCKA